MHPLLKKIRLFLSRKEITALVFCIALAAKLIVQFNYFTVDGDKSSQLLAAKNLANGHGITIRVAADTNLNTSTWQPLKGWPPGYSISVAPLILLFDGDYKTAALLFDTLTVLFFLGILLLLGKQTGLQTWLQNLFLLFAGFFFYPFGPSTSTDMVSLSCLLAAFYCLLNLMQTGSGIKRHLVFSVFFLFLSGFYRYQYIPVAAAIPFLLIIAGMLNKKKEWIRAGFKIQIPLFVLLACLFFFQQKYTGSGTYVNSLQTGFYYSNLQRLYPFVPASFADIETGLGVMSRFTGTDYYKNGALLINIGYIIFFGLFIYTIHWLWKRRNQLNQPATLFVYLGTGIGLAVILLLYYLSIRNSALISRFFLPWTYLQEFRYFLFPVILIQLAVFRFLFARYNSLKKFWKIVAMICLLLSLLQTGHKIYTTGKILSQSGAFIPPSEIYRQEVQAFIDFFRQQEKAYPDYELLVASPDNNFGNYAGLENISAYYISHTLSVPLRFHSATPVKILLVMTREMAEYYAPLLGFEASTPIHTIRNQYFYLLNALPLQR